MEKTRPFDNQTVVHAARSSSRSEEFRDPLREWKELRKKQKKNEHRCFQKYWNNGRCQCETCHRMHESRAAVIGHYLIQHRFITRVYLLDFPRVTGVVHKTSAPADDR